MPVPKSTVENSPRKLLRDVVLEKMLAAIQDGTLQAGERLNDDELVQWLGVSRTPIREAIAKLVDYGLVEMEANRYTRVATPTQEQYVDAYQMLFGMTELAARWGIPKLGDEEAAQVSAILDETYAHAQHEDPAISEDVERIIGFLVAATGNELMQTTMTSLLTRAKFVRIGSTEFQLWDLKDGIDVIRAAVSARDGDAAAGVFRALGLSLAAHMERVRASA